MFLKFFEKNELISLYWFAVEWQTSTSRWQNSYMLYVKFCPELHEPSLTFEIRLEVAKK